MTLIPPPLPANLYSLGFFNHLDLYQPRYLNYGLILSPLPANLYRLKFLTNLDLYRPTSISQDSYLILTSTGQDILIITLFTSTGQPLPARIL